MDTPSAMPTCSYGPRRYGINQCCLWIDTGTAVRYDIWCAVAAFFLMYRSVPTADAEGTGDDSEVASHPDPPDVTLRSVLALRVFRRRAPERKKTNRFQTPAVVREGRGPLSRGGFVLASGNRPMLWCPRLHKRPRAFVEHLDLFSTPFRRQPTPRGPEQIAGRASERSRVRRIFRYPQIDAALRLSPSACSEMLKKGVLAVSRHRKGFF